MYSPTDNGQSFSAASSDGKRMYAGNIAQATFSGIPISAISSDTRHNDSLSIASTEPGTDLLSYFRTETERFSESIDVTDYNIDAGMLEEYYELLVFCSPRSYYLTSDSGKYSYYYDLTSNDAGEKIIQYLYPVYQLDIYDSPTDIYINRDRLNELLPDITEKQNRFDAFINNILDSVHSGSDTSDLTKLMYIHDYIIQNFSYDFDCSITDNDGNIYRRNNIMFMVDNLPVACQTYSILLNYLAMNEGIKTSFVTSSDQNGNAYHTWNLVEIAAPQNGSTPKWYHVDATWDDTSVPEGCGSAMTYFMISDDTIRRTHSDLWDGDRYITYPSLELNFGNEFDDASWRDTCSQAVEHDGFYYYLTYDTETDETCLNKCRADGAGTAEIIYSYDGQWMYMGAYSGLVLSGSSLYFNTAYDIIRYSVADGAVSVIPVECNDGAIYSCYEKNGRLYCNVSDNIYSYDIKSTLIVKPELQITLPSLKYTNGAAAELTLELQSDFRQNIRITVKECASDGTYYFHAYNIDDLVGSETAVIRLLYDDSRLNIYIWDDAMVPYRDVTSMDNSR
ncbi:MAG: hypothetical protein PUD92_02720 [Clostridiales bacterium]|nr:hypothetical protein [Clostridiales bacterium]